MTKVGLLSDTHGYWDEKYLQYFEDCDEIWHAGDIGSLEVAQKLAAFRPFRAVYGNIENMLHLQISEEQKSNADSIYNLVRYGVAGGSEGWIPGADVPFIGADGFCSPIGSGWERRVTSEFGNRVDPITGKRKGHGGMDLAVPTGTPIRTALPGTVTVSKYNAGGYGYYVMIEHGNGIATLYGHCSKLLARVGQTVQALSLIHI